MADVKNTLSLELQVKYDQAMKALGEVRTALASVTQGTSGNAAGGDIGGIQKALVDLKASIAEVKTAIASIGQGSASLGTGISGQANKAKAELNDLKNSITGVGDAAGGAAGGGLSLMTSRLAGLSIGVFTMSQVADAVLDVGRALLEAQGRLDNFRAGIQFALGRQAGADLDYVRETAMNLGLELTSLSRSYVQFMAASRGTSLEGQRARDVFEAVAQASSVLGLSAERQEGALRALAQMMSKGTVQAEELRGQLGDQLPGAFRLAAQAMGVTEGELSKMLERGEIIASDFLPKLAAALRTQLGDASVTAAGGAQQAINRLASAWEQFLQSVSDSGVGQVLKSTLNSLSGALTEVSSAFESATRSGDGFFTTIAKGYAAYAGYVLRGFEKEAEALEASIRKNEELLQQQVRNGYDPKGSTVSAIQSKIDRDRAELDWMKDSGGNSDWVSAEQRKSITEQRDAAERRRRLEGEIGTEISKNLSNVEKAEKALLDFRSKYALLAGTGDYKKLESELVRKLAEARETEARKGVAQPIPSARKVFDTEAELAIDAARRQERALQESYGVRLTDLDTYMQRRRQIADQALAAETAKQQAVIDAQQELLKKLAGITPKTEIQAQTISDRKTDAQRQIEQAQANQEKARRDRADVDRTLGLFEVTERLAQMERTRTLVAEGYREVQDRIRLAVERRELTEREAQDHLAELNKRAAEGLRAQAAEYDRIAEAGGVFAEAAARAAAGLRLEADKLGSTLTFLEKRFQTTADRIDGAFKDGLANVFERIGEKGTKAADLVRDAFVSVGKAIRRSLAEIAAEDTLDALNKSLGTGPDGKPNTIGRVLSRAIGVDGSSRDRALWIRNADAAPTAGTGAGGQGIMPGDVKGVPTIGDVLESVGSQLREVFGGWIDGLGSLLRDVANSLSDVFSGLFSGSGGGGGFGDLIASLFSGGSGGGGGGGSDFLSTIFGSFFHSGGVVGGGRRSGRMIDPSAWINAPRFHSGGVAGDEIAAVLKRGEEVLTADDPRHVKNAAAGGGVKVELINQGTPQRATSSAARFDGRQLIVQVFTEDLADNGPMSRAIADTLGGNRAAGLS